MLNKNELILEKVRKVVNKDLSTDKVLYMLKQIEDPSLVCTAETDEITDAFGATITTLYKAKKATFSGNNALFSTDLAAAQYGTSKEVATANAKITDIADEIFTVASGTTTVTLSHTPKGDIPWVYSLVDGDIGTAYAAGDSASVTEFVVSGTTLTVPTGFTGKLYVEYEYDSENAMKVTNMASNFPTAVKLIIYAYFKDICNENLVYSGKIIVPKAKLNPESVELALTTGGRHAFTYQIFKDYCTEEGADEMFSIIISQ